jgi:eukaryotic-like serine/threonine-protein kinase
VASADRGSPQIPDYEILGYIGGGAYGEVWLGQTLTGTLRAVKIVWREDFDFTKTFEREFEGIREFEPVSRSHPNLVHVYHVGWMADRGLYYYVMELGDDEVRGWDIDPASYRPRTLRSDLEIRRRLGLKLCLDYGIKLARALGHLHSYGLSHRDIKPPNIIFVHGEPKLADIGLVAVAGEKSYVGTEGFVPPEGPGSSVADIYSLGKVLYEISTGLDRNEFPSIPSDFTEAELAIWRPMNEVICKAAHPDASRRYQSAQAFGQALEQVRYRLRHPPKPVARMISAYFLSTIFLGALLALLVNSENTVAVLSAPPPMAVAAPVLPKPPTRPIGSVAELASGEPWLNSAGIHFSFQDNAYRSVSPISITAFKQYLEETSLPFAGAVVELAHKENEPYVLAVVVPPGDATAFADWMTGKDREIGLLGMDDFYRIEPAEVMAANDVPAPEGAGGPAPVGFHLRLGRHTYGRVVIETAPGGAAVFDEQGQSVGVTPLLLERVRTGPVRFSVELQGYQRLILEGDVRDDVSLVLTRMMQPGRAVVFGQMWENSVGMKFVPVQNLMVAAHETTQGDFDLWKKETGQSTEGQATSSEPGKDKLPASGVNRRDAIKFCEWLTDRERSGGMIDVRHEYRLPKDQEWSRFCDLPMERGDSPAERSGNIRGIFPWLYAWPPPHGAGNYGDMSAKEMIPSVIEAYDDTFPRLAPIGSFPANYLGLFDLGGNVREWVAENYGGGDPATQGHGVLRGGGWRDSVRDELMSSHRFFQPEDKGEPDSGFRIVLAPLGETIVE